MDSDRAKRILAALVREYIASGEPVPSSLLVGLAGLGVSSATVRNMLAQLEARRVSFSSRTPLPAASRPTAGTASTLICCSNPNRSTPYRPGRGSAAAARDGGALVDSVLSQVSHVVSQASKHVGFALRPAHQAAVFDRVEFVPLSSSRVLVVHRRPRRPRPPEGHRDQRAAALPTICARRPIT